MNADIFNRILYYSHMIYCKEKTLILYFYMVVNQVKMMYKEIIQC